MKGHKLRGGWLQLFAEVSATGTPNPGGQEGEPVKTKVPIGGKPNEPPESKKEGEPEPVAVFKTHEELNARLDRAGKSALEKAAKEAGFESAEAMAAAAKKAKEIEDANKTEQQKQADRIKTLEGEAELGRNALKRARFETAATSKGVPTDRLDAAFKLADLSNVTVDMTSQTVTGLDDVLTGLLAANAFLVATATPPTEKKPPTGGGPSNPGKGADKTIDERIAETESAMLAEKDFARRAQLSRELLSLQNQKMRGAK